MVRCDRRGVYHGHSAGVTMYDWKDGSRLWDQPTRGPVLLAGRSVDAVYAGTSERYVYRFGKDGSLARSTPVTPASSPVQRPRMARYVFAGDCFSSIYCFEGGRTAAVEDGHGLRLGLLHAILG